MRATTSLTPQSTSSFRTAAVCLPSVMYLAPSFIFVVGDPFASMQAAVDVGMLRLLLLLPSLTLVLIRIAATCSRLQGDGIGGVFPKPVRLAPGHHFATFGKCCIIASQPIAVRQSHCFKLTSSSPHICYPTTSPRSEHLHCADPPDWFDSSLR